MKYLFFDWDGTLMGRSRKLNPINIEAIRKAQSLGHMVFLCSGRSPRYLHQATDTYFKADGFVGCAGGCVELDGELVFENRIPKALLDRVRSLFEKNQVFYNLETKDCVYASMEGNHKMTELLLRMMKLPPERAGAIEKEMTGGLNGKLADFKEEYAVQKLVFFTENTGEWQAIEDSLRNDFFFNYFFRTREALAGEIIPKSCTKQNGISKVLDFYSAKWSDTIGFGDSMNDYQMLEHVGTAVVWEEADEALLALADHTFPDPDEGGIARAMEKLQLVGKEA